MKKRLACLALALSLVVALCPMASAATSGSDFDSAISVSMGKSYSNTLTDTDTESYYKFTLNQSGTVKLSGTSYIEIAHIEIYDVDQKRISYETVSWNELAQKAALNIEYALTSGSYYMRFYTSSGYLGASKFNFKLSFTSAKESFKEGNGGSNNIFDTANKIKLNKKYRGQIAINDVIDCYRLKLSKKRKLQIKVNSYIATGTLAAYVYDPLGNLASNTLSSLLTITNKGSKTLTVSLKAGTYYFCVGSYAFYGNYDFKIVPDNKLKAPRHVKAKKKSSTSAKVSWKKVSKAKGYQIKLGTNKKITKHVKKATAKKSAKSKVVKNLTKGKKYYVKVRAYKKSNGQKSYGKWSKTKSMRL